MADTGTALVDQITQDLAYPECGYNLRGLRGDRVACPECGTHVDVAKLVSAGWNQPWYSAPGLSMLFMPTAIAAMGVLGVPVAAVLGKRMNLPDETLIYYAVVVAGIWLWSMVRTYRNFGRLEGPALALLGHVLFVTYILLILVPVVLVTWGVLSALDGDLWAVPAAILGLLLVLGTFPVARGCEKMIAHRCIRWHLQSRSIVRD